MEGCNGRAYPRKTLALWTSLGACLIVFLYYHCKDCAIFCLENSCLDKPGLDNPCNNPFLDKAGLENP